VQSNAPAVVFILEHEGPLKLDVIADSDEEVVALMSGLLASERTRDLLFTFKEMGATT
jgi:hypothetical protein